MPKLVLEIKLMPELQPSIEYPEAEKPLLSELEKEISPEKIEKLPDWPEACAFYRGLPAKDALMALLGELKLEAAPKEDVLGPRDNSTINSTEAIAYAPTSQTKKGKKFLCAIGFDPLPETIIKNSCLGQLTQFQITGPILSKEVIIRFSGEKPGQPGQVKFFSPKEFYQWYINNVE